MSIEFSTKSFEPNWSVDSLWWGIGSKNKWEVYSEEKFRKISAKSKEITWRDIHNFPRILWWSTTMDYHAHLVDWYELVCKTGDKGQIEKYISNSRKNTQEISRGYAAWLDANEIVDALDPNKVKNLAKKSAKQRASAKQWASGVKKIFDQFGSVSDDEKEQEQISKKLEKLWYSDVKHISDIFEYDSELWLVVSQTLFFIKEWNLNNFNSNVILSDEWKEALKRYLEKNNIVVQDLNSITIGWLNENVFKREKEYISWAINDVIGHALNDRFLDSLDKWLWTTLDVKDADVAVDKVIKTPALLQLFVDFYEYEKPGYLTSLWIVDGSHLSSWQQQIVKDLIKRNLYRNGLLVSLSEEEKADIDNKMEMEHKRAKRRYEMWSRNNRYKEMAAKRREILEKQVDYDMAPGWKISYDMKIWDKLLDKYNSSVENLDLHDERVFKVARASFFRKYEWLLSDKISKDPSEVKDLYRNTAWFTNFENDSMEEIKKLCKDQDEFSQLCSTLGLFSSHLKESQKLLSGFASKLNTKKDTGINNIAVGSVIDGIRKIFSSIKLQDSDKKEQLKFDVKNPAELDDDNNSLLFNWSFKWEPVKIKYDLLTWELYMNTSIREMNGVGQWKIVFWEKDPNLYVWTIEDFSSIIEYYGNPINDLQKERLNSENTGSRERRLNMRSMMESEITRIWEKVKSLEANQIKNGVTTDFLKSLGIIDENTKWTVHFEEWSDVYKVVQLINKSKKEDIDFFQQTMRKLSDFIWINWWNKISNKNAVEYRTILANQSNLNNGVNDLSVLNNFWENIKDFSYYNGSPWLISKDCKNWIATVIYENFVKWESPNRYLDKGTIYDYWKNIVQQYDTLEWYSGLEGV